MTHLVQQRDQIFVKSYGFLSFAKNMGRNIGENISKKLSSKYSQKGIDHAKQSATDTIKTASKRAIQKIAEATHDLIGNKIETFRITKLSKNSSKNNSETNEEILGETFIPSELRHKMIDDLKII